MASKQAAGHGSFAGSRLPDMLAFAAGIAWAWWTGWDTRTLVWSLWLSSLAVGAVSIVIGIVATVRTSRNAMRAGILDTGPWSPTLVSRFATQIACLHGALLLLFFTLHFGGFHWGHSIFLNMFFPLDGGDPATRQPLMQPREYLQAIALGGWFVPLALVAERRRLFGPAADATASGTAPDPRMSAPYRNVIRLHLLIFVFSFAMFAGVGGAWIYLIVYAAYFFPWRRDQRRTPASGNVA